MKKIISIKEQLGALTYITAFDGFKKNAKIYNNCFQNPTEMHTNSYRFFYQAYTIKEALNIRDPQMMLIACEGTGPELIGLIHIYPKISTIIGIDIKRPYVTNVREVIALKDKFNYTFKVQDLTHPLQKKYDFINYSGPDFGIMGFNDLARKFILIMPHIETIYNRSESVFKIIKNCIDALNPQGLLQMSTHTLFEFFILKKWLSENPKLDVKVVYEKTLHSGPISELDNTYRNNVGWMVLQKKGTER